MSATYATKTSLPLGTRPNVKKLSALRTPLGTVKIARQGGSETYGYGVWENSYAYDLNGLLTTRGGITPSWVGCYTNASADAGIQLSHAIPGHAVDTFGPGGVNDIGASPLDLATYDPDILICDTVINTAANNTLTAAWLTDATDFFLYALGLMSAGRLVIMTGFEGGDAARNANVDTINTHWPDVVSALDGAGYSDRYVIAEARIIAANVDQDPAEPIGSRLHWNARGGLKIADCLFPAVMNALGLDAVW